jgi:hypothetical protein
MTEKLNNTIIIMIDTTLYEYKIEDINDYCPNVFPHIERNYEKLYNEQKNQIIQILQSNQTVNNIVIIGHHPIITVKNKKNNVLNGLINLFNDIKEFLNNKQIYYLCADNHLQQKGIINFNDIKIKQYVAGTGGADLDECPENPVNSELIYKFDNINYQIIKCKSTYGFYLIEEIDNELQFNFIDMNIDNDKDEYKNKYLKYKQKYLKLKYHT